MTQTVSLHLEDLAVGARFESGSEIITEENIREFAQRFDPQPFHLDAAAAKDTFFKGLAASGWHTAAVTMGLLVRNGVPLANGIIGAGGEIGWPAPTRPGDELHVESVTKDVTPSRSRPERGIATVESRTVKPAR